MYTSQLEKIPEERDEDPTTLRKQLKNTLRQY